MEAERALPFGALLAYHNHLELAPSEGSAGLGGDEVMRGCRWGGHSQGGKLGYTELGVHVWAELLGWFLGGWPDSSSQGALGKPP